MSWVTSTVGNGIATVCMQRGKVNALNELMVGELQQAFQDLKADSSVKAVILTGSGKFFSFGFDIPEFISYPRNAFEAYIQRFSRFCNDLFLFPKPLVVALNGHTIAGGCVLAIAGDARIMVSGKAKISLNEITFGSTVFPSIMAQLQYWVGSRQAQAMLFSGEMYSAEAALAMGLVDQVVEEADIIPVSRLEAMELAEQDTTAFASLKKLLRRPHVEAMQPYEAASIQEFLDIWYSPATREKLKQIQIHE
ncbi:enoyl-CoA hydratase/isomerase family protein [Desulfobacca acetoxidans]|uniref:Enoyl-CoA hydratase/isomerase n=1 Tax=Desulfobacca acetoxidans (strain ATCC 700848 / DSM 11109 / ASRB2) TaxID=880072 RepID=F2NIV6_DESAR|nr:enoyl-CoA hydratase/isomerase family protein [Desulfobacca acetoxidans]AEB10650.1 Enoyl-CoA hydratase/isomerase [Desulfobacca acetoxidans DSM 11109]